MLDDQGRLYLRRAYESKRVLADLILARTRRPDLAVDWTLADAGIERFVEDVGSEDDSPKAALRTALARPLAIVTGGPGTGKTTMIARLTALLI